MKKFAAILLSAALVAPLASPTLAQPADRPNQKAESRSGREDRDGREGRDDSNAARPGEQARGRDQGPARSYKAFRKGEKFDSRRARNYQAIDYRRYKRLKAPPKGYRYVRAGDDILLISAAGVVAAVTSGAFR